MKFKYSTENDIPEALKAYFAKQQDGTFHLQCEGAVAADRLAEFRDNNTALIKQVADLNTKFKDIDPDEARALLAKSDEIKAAKVVKSEDVDKLIAERVAAVQKTAKTELDAVTAKATAAATQLAKLTIHGKALEIAAAAGLRPSAQADLIARAERTWSLNDQGQPVATGPDGKALYSPKDASPLGMAEWMESQLKDAPHLFESGKGSGSQGGAGGGSGGGNQSVNPFDPKTHDLAAQGALYRSDKATAVRLAAMHGVTLPA